MGSVIESVTDPIFVLRKEPFNMDDLQPLRVDETPTYDRKAFFVQGVRVGHTNEKHHYELVREDKDGYYIYKPKKSKKTIYGIPCPKPFIITENIVPELEAYSSHLSWSSCNDVSGKKGSVFHNFCENHSSVIPDHTGIVRALFDDVDSGIIIPI